MAKFIGALLGFFWGGFLGAILGYFIGGFFSSSARGKLRHSYTAHNQSPEIFFSTTFLLMGHIAKADGRISEEEISQAEALMGKMGVVGGKREAAIGLFKQGAAADFDMQSTLAEFVTAARFRPDLKRNLIMFLVEMAMADEELHNTEESMLRRVATALNIDMRSFEQMLEMLKAQHAFSGSAHKPSSADELTMAYKALGVPASATDKELKRAYRKLMSQYHPDKMIAKGVPEDMLAIATEKTQEIQAAYDIIERTRK